MTTTRRRRLTRVEQQAETRTRLLDAAVAVCSRRGLHEATLDEISEAAGFTRGAVYSNFAGKEDLLLTVFEERIEPRLRAIATPLIESRTAREQSARMREFMRSLLNEERRHLLLLIEFWGFAARNPKLARRFAEVRRRRREGVEQMIEQRLERFDGELRVPVEDLAGAFVAATIGALFEGLVDRRLEADRLQSVAYELILRGSSR